MTEGPEQLPAVSWLVLFLVAASLAFKLILLLTLLVG